VSTPLLEETTFRFAYAKQRHYEALGYKVFGLEPYDEETQKLEDWVNKRRYHVSYCDIFVIIIVRTSRLFATMIQDEVLEAERLHKRIIVCKLSSVYVFPPVDSREILEFDDEHSLIKKLDSLILYSV
jgi:hypothetical protein